MGDRYVKSHDNKKTLYSDAKNLYSHSMSQALLYDEIKFEKNVKLEDIIYTPDGSDIGYFIEVDLSDPENINENFFPTCSWKQKFFPDKLNTYTNKNKPTTHTQTKNLLCDWTDKKIFLIHYRMLKIFVREGW